jgi:hypothetical protein
VKQPVRRLTASLFRGFQRRAWHIPCDRQKRSSSVYRHILTENFASFHRRLGPDDRAGKTA